MLSSGPYGRKELGTPLLERAHRFLTTRDRATIEAAADRFFGALGYRRRADAASGAIVFERGDRHASLWSASLRKYRTQLEITVQGEEHARRAAAPGSAATAATAATAGLDEPGGASTAAIRVDSGDGESPVEADTRDGDAPFGSMTVRHHVETGLALVNDRDRRYLDVEARAFERFLEHGNVDIAEVIEAAQNRATADMWVRIAVFAACLAIALLVVGAALSSYFSYTVHFPPKR